jgi:hypothetical protein
MMILKNKTASLLRSRFLSLQNYGSKKLITDDIYPYCPKIFAFSQHGNVILILVKLLVR